RPSCGECCRSHIVLDHHFSTVGATGRQAGHHVLTNRVAPDDADALRGRRSRSGGGGRGGRGRACRPASGESGGMTPSSARGIPRRWGLTKMERGSRDTRGEEGGGR